MAVAFHKLKVADVRRETADAVSIAFTVPPELQEDYRFSPGQHLTLRRDCDGQDIRRSYSICNGLDDGELRVAVKKVEGGVFSTLCNDAIKPGDTIDVMTPQGRFGVMPDPAKARNYLAVAAGSGSGAGSARSFTSRTISPSRASATTRSPGWNVLWSKPSASGSSIATMIARRIGRAP